jgi:hypothetical protein
MTWQLKIVTAVVALAVSISFAAAADPRCSTPPYGGSVVSYKAFIKNFGPLLDDPSRMLSGVCDAKFGGDRKGLYNLGFTDADIAGKDTSELAVDLIGALKNLADRAK